MPRPKKKSRPLNDEEMLTQLNVMNAALGGETHGE